MSVFEETYGSADVIRAAGVSNDVLQIWIRRGLILGAPGKGVHMPGRQGLRREFTYFNVVEIAVAAALISAGVSNKSAFQHAASFAHVGTGPLPKHPGREPAMPFAAGVTYLAVAGDESVVLQHTPGQGDMMVMINHHLGKPRTVILVNASRVVGDVLTALDRDPEAEIAAAYQVAA